MTDSQDVFITFAPRSPADAAPIAEALEAAALPVAEQTQFAGRIAIETVVGYGKAGLETLAALIRKLFDADRIAEVTIELGDRRVVMKGVPKEGLDSVEQLAARLIAELEP